MPKITLDVLKKRAHILKQKDLIIRPLRELLEGKGVKAYDFRQVYPYIVHLLIPSRSVIIEINKPVADGDDFFRINHFKELGFYYKNFDKFDFDEIYNFIMSCPENDKAMSNRNSFASLSLLNKKTKYTLSQPYVRIKYD